MYRPVTKLAGLAGMAGFVANLGCGIFLVALFPPPPVAMTASITAERGQLLRAPGSFNQTTVFVVPKGGTAPYSYQWTVVRPDGIADSTRLDASDRQSVRFSAGDIDGPYRLSCIVSDAEGAVHVAALVLQVGGDLGLDITTQRLGVVAGGGQYGQTLVHLNVSSGTPPFSVNWVCTAPDGRIDNERLDTGDALAPRFTSCEQVGTYVLTATIVDALGAIATHSTILVVGQTLGVDVVAERSTVSPDGGPAGTVRLLATAIGGTEPYTYQWEVIGPDGSDRTDLLWDNRVASPLLESDGQTGTFIARCAVTDAAGTLLLGSATLTVSSIMNLGITADRLALPAGAASGQYASLTASVRGSQGGVSLQWAVAGPNDQDFSGQLSSLDGPTTFFTPPDLPGVYVIRCTASDENGEAALDALAISVGGTLGITVLTSNQSPALGGAAPAGTANLSARVYGGTPPYTYAWTVTDPAGQQEDARIDDPASATPKFTSALQPGAYAAICTVTDSLGDSAADVVVLNVGQPLNVNVSINRQTLIAGGGVSGQAQLFATINGGAVPYAIQWSVVDPNQLTDPGRLSDPYAASPVFTSAGVIGTYRLTLTTTDAMGAIFVDSVEVTVANAGTGQYLSASATIDRQSLGTGGATATARVLTTGGVAPIAYAWSVTNPNGDAENARLDSTSSDTVMFTSVALQGTYRLRCTVSDTAGHIFTDSVQLTVSDQFSLDLIAAQTYLAPGGTVELLADSRGGRSPYTYAWSCVDAADVTAGAFTYGATGSGSALTAGVGDFTNIWTAPVGSGALSAYRIRVTATDAQGNSLTDSIVVTVNDSLLANVTADKVYVLPGQQVSLNAHPTGGSGALTYAWTSRNAAGNAAGVFTAGSTGTGSATQTGTGDATNTWTAPLPGAGSLGSYRISVSVTDAHGSSFTDTVTVIVDDPFSLDVVSANLSLAAGGTAALTANRSGGQGDYTFTWTARDSAGAVAGTFGTGSTGPGQATQAGCPDDTTNVWTAPAAATGAAGMYLLTCTATDALGRTFVDSTAVAVGMENPALVSLAADRVFVAPGATISLTAVRSGGVANFDYTWTVVNAAGAAAGTLGSQNQNGLSGNAGNTWTAPAAASGVLGTYRVQVVLRDALGHQATETLHVVVASPVTLDVRANSPLVSPSTLVSLTASPVGGEPPFDFSWQALDSSGANAGTFTVGAGAAGAAMQVNISGAATNAWSEPAEGRYTIICTVTDNVGQSFVDSIPLVVTAQQMLILDVRADRATAAPGETVNLLADATGGSANFNYSWSVLNEAGASAGTLGAATQNGLAGDAVNTWTAPTGAGADGTYRIICSLTDARGRTFVDSTVIEVSSLAIQNIFLAPGVNPQLLPETNLTAAIQGADPGGQFSAADGLVSPGHPRNVVISIYDDNTSITGGLARVSGLDARGLPASEVIVIGPSQALYTNHFGVQPFAIITGVDLFGFTGTVDNSLVKHDKVTILAGDKFGLTGLIRTAQDVVYVYEGTSVITSGYTVDASAGQQGITFASAPDGSRNYIVVFRAR